MSLPIKNPLIVALDVDTKAQAMDLAEQLQSVVGAFKIGPRLVMRYGESLTQTLSSMAPVFVDMKHFDIPNTMISSVKASFEAGASLVTVHALSGPTALKEMAQLEKELAKKREFKILAVTILTSWNEAEMKESFTSAPVSEHVVQLATQVKNSGLSSVVCSAHEISLLKKLGLNLVTPGIRLSDESTQDQKRVMGPQEAIQAGTHAIVVGRPIIEAKDPYQAALKYQKLL